MAQQWFYQVMEKQIGPVSSAELRTLAQRGTITTETPIANAPNGPWVPAVRVKGLFAAPNATPPSTAVKGTAQVPPHAAAAQDEPSRLSAATKIMMGVCGGVCVLMIGFLVWFIATRDTWELDNASRVSAKLEEADRLQRSDPLTAYQTYDEVLKEAQQHKITDGQFAQKLANAEKSRTVMYQKVQENIRAQEAEKQRLAEDEAKRAAEEKQRLAEDEAKRAAEEKQRIAQDEERKRAAEEKTRAEKKRLEELIAAYRNAPQSARNALNAVKKVEARTEVGIGYKDYSTVVGEAWADVKIFTESPEGKKLPAFSFLLVSAMGKYKLTLGILHEDEERVQIHHNFKEVRLVSGTLLQQSWGAAHRRIDMAEQLISQDDIAATLLRVLRLQNTDAQYEATLRSVQADLVTLTSQMSDAIGAETFGMDVSTFGQRHPEHENKAKELSQKLDDIDKQDKQGP